MTGNDLQPLVTALQAWETGDLAKSIARVPERPEAQAFQRLRARLRGTVTRLRSTTWWWGRPRPLSACVRGPCGTVTRLRR